MIEEARIGVFVCHCGVNIAHTVNVPETVESVKTLPDVVHAEETLYACSSEGISRIKESIKEHSLNRVIVASCTPRTHEPLFRSACEEVGLNKYLFEMVNIREQCSWVHPHEPERATEKAKDLIRMAVSRARLLEPEQEPEVEVKPSTLVIGSGVSGLTAAACLGNQGFDVHLIEKDTEIGGTVKELYKLYPTGETASEIIAPLIEAVSGKENIKILTSTTVDQVSGSVGDFDVTLKNGGENIKLSVGTIIVATGAVEYNPTGSYLYGEHSGVLTQLELEKRLKQGNLQELNRVALILCGRSLSSQNGTEYCSRIGCTVALKNALLLKELNPSAEIYVFNRDLRTYGKENENCYITAQEQDTKFVKYLKERPPEVYPSSNGGLRIKAYDALLHEEMEMDCDLVILSSPLVQHQAGMALSPILKIPIGSDKFFMEAHVKLRPVDTQVDGIYIAGAASGPKSARESIGSALAATAKAGTLLAAGKVRGEALMPKVNRDICIGCSICVELCPYNAMQKDGTGVATVTETVCKGCGTCGASCPQRAITMRHFTDQEILAQAVAAIGRMHS